MSQWALKMEVWPYFDGGDEQAQAKVGPRERTYKFEAGDFDEAVRIARVFRDGVKSHDKVWEAPIHSLVKVGP